MMDFTKAAYVRMLHIKILLIFPERRGINIFLLITKLLQQQYPGFIRLVSLSCIYLCKSPTYTISVRYDKSVLKKECYSQQKCYFKYFLCWLCWVPEELRECVVIVVDGGSITVV